MNNSLKSGKRLIKSQFRFFNTLDIPEYFENYHKSIKNEKVEIQKLKPLKDSNHDLKNFRCQLFSVPFKNVELDSLVLDNIVAKYVPDVIFIQYDPMVYLHRQRIFSYKCYLEETGETHETHQIKGLEIPHALGIRELVVNPLVLDMSHASNSNIKLEMDKGFMNYHKKAFEDEEIHDNFSNMLINSITKFIFNYKLSMYYSLNHLIYQGILGRQKVLLGDMPEILLRLSLGNTILIDEARDMFKSVLLLIDKHKGKFSVKEITLAYYSHIFQQPKDLYMVNILKQMMKEYDSGIAFVGAPHFEPIKYYWNENLTYKDAIEVPNKIVGETDYDLIEKQAIIDVLMDTRLWNESYIVNPFQYIEKDAFNFTKENYENYKIQYKTFIEKYERMKLKSYETYENLINFEKQRRSQKENPDFSIKNYKNKFE